MTKSVKSARSTYERTWTTKLLPCFFNFLLSRCVISQIVAFVVLTIAYYYIYCNLYRL